MKVLLLIDIAAFKEERYTALDRCLLTASRLLSCAIQLDEKGAIRWGYRIINSQYEPEAFATRYKNVDGHPDKEFPSGSPLQKGGADLLEISSEGIIQFARVLQKLTHPEILPALTSLKSDDCSSNTTVGRFQCIQKYFALLQTYFTDGKGSLQDGENIASEHGPGLVLLFSAAPRTPQDALTFLELDAVKTDMARADIWSILSAAAKPGLGSIFGSMEVQPCWIDTGAPASAVPQGDAAEDWRVGVQQLHFPNASFRYGVVGSYAHGRYHIRYDDGKLYEHVDPGRCDMDWVQPDALNLASVARKEVGQTGGTYKERSCTEQICASLDQILRRFGVGGCEERAVFSLRDLASPLDTLLISAHYAPLFSHLKAVDRSSVCAQLAQLASAEGLVTDGMGSVKQLAASLQPAATTGAGRKGTIMDRAKEIKKGRKMEEKAARKAAHAKRTVGRTGMEVKQNRASPPEVGSTRPSPGTASIQVNGREGREQSLPPAESPGAMRTDGLCRPQYDFHSTSCAPEMLEAASRFRDELHTSLRDPQLCLADLYMMERRADALVKDAVKALLRFEAAEMEEAGKGAHQSAGAPQAGRKWNAGKGADPKLAAAVRVLAAGLLLGWEQIHAKHPNHRSETAGQKCARRDEQLLQLLLRMHILATLATKLDAKVTKRQRREVVELFDQLGISLIGDGVSAADVYNSVLQPCFGAQLPDLMQPLAESCGQAEDSLPSLPSLGTRVTGSFAKHSQNSECCGSVSPSDISTGNARDSSFGNRPRDVCRSSSMLSGSHSACQTGQGGRDIQHARPAAKHLLVKQKAGRPALERMASRSRLAPVVGKLSIADLQRKRRDRKRHGGGSRPGSAAVRGKAAPAPSQPISTTPDAQRTHAGGSTVMTPQSRRKATPDEDVDVECIPETEIKGGGSHMISADVASRPLMRQPCFGGIPVTDEQGGENLALFSRDEEEAPPADGRPPLQDVGVKQPTAQGTWLFPAQNKRNAPSRAKLQAAQQPPQLPPQRCLLESLDFQVGAAEKVPAAPHEHHSPAQHDMPPLPHMAVSAAAELQLQSPSPIPRHSPEVLPADDSIGVWQEDVLPSEVQEDIGEVGGPAAASGEDGDASKPAAASVDGSLPADSPMEEAEAAEEAQEPPPEPEQPAARDPYEFDTDEDAASDGRVELYKSAPAHAAREEPASAAQPEQPQAAPPVGAATAARRKPSTSPCYSDACMQGAGQALTQLADIINRLPSEASPAEATDAVPSCKGGADRHRPRRAQPRSAAPAEAGVPASGVSTRSGRRRHESGAGDELQHPKGKRRKAEEPAEAADADAVPGRHLRSGKVVAESAGPASVRKRRESQAGQPARVAAAGEAAEAPSRPATRSSKQPLASLALPPAGTPAGQKRKGQPSRATPKPRHSSQKQQAESGPEPTACPEDEAAGQGCASGARPQRKRQTPLRLDGAEYELPSFMAGPATGADAPCGKESSQEVPVLTENRSSQPSQTLHSLQPAARREDSAAAQQRPSALQNVRPQRDRRLSAHLGSGDFELPGFMARQAMAAKAAHPEQLTEDRVEPASAPDGGADTEHCPDADLEGAVMPEVAHVSASESDGPALHGEAAQDSGCHWDTIVMSPLAEGSAAQGQEHANAAVPQQQEPPCEAQLPPQEQPAVAGSQLGTPAQADPDLFVRRSTRKLGVVEHEPLDFFTPAPRSSRPRVTLGTAAARTSGCAPASAGGPRSAAAAEAQTPAPFRSEQVKAAAETLLQRKKARKLAPGSAAACSAGQASSWGTQADQHSEGEQATAEVSSGILEGKVQQQNKRAGASRHNSCSKMTGVGQASGDAGRCRAKRACKTPKRLQASP